MLKKIRSHIAAWVFRFELDAILLRQRGLDREVNQRVADTLLKMDPFEPLMRKYHVVFSEEFAHVEDKLSEQSRFQLFSWAYSLESDPSFKYLSNWILNTQGNNTIRKSKNDHEWLYGRAALATIALVVEEVSRLASHYREILAKREGKGFDPSLPVE